MTEQEAMEVLKKACLCDYDLSKTGVDCDIKQCDKRDAVLQAIKALEEVQTYRAIGTPEECRAAAEKQKEIKNNVVDDFVERAMKQFTDFDLKHGYPTVTDCKVILRDIAEQMKGSADNEQID